MFFPSFVLSLAAMFFRHLRHSSFREIMENRTDRIRFCTDYFPQNILSFAIEKKVWVHLTMSSSYLEKTKSVFFRVKNMRGGISKWYPSAVWANMRVKNQRSESANRCRMIKGSETDGERKFQTCNCEDFPDCPSFWFWFLGFY